MRKSELEGRLLQLADRVEANQPIEDSFVELKSEWIPPERAARRLAGHCNAAGGIPIIWAIGLDEERGVVGATDEEFADWWARVTARFDSVAPELALHLCVPRADKTLVGLLVETDRAPYVVKNPAGGEIAREVPWREGTAVRTATRENLLRLLLPFGILPDLEVLEAKLELVHENGVEKSKFGVLRWRCSARLYLTPQDHHILYIPNHTVRGSGRATGVDPITLADIRIQPEQAFSVSKDDEGRTRVALGRESRTIERTSNELIFHGPGLVVLDSETIVPARLDAPTAINYAARFPARVTIQMRPSRAGRDLVLDMQLPRTRSDGETFIEWSHVVSS